MPAWLVTFNCLSRSDNIHTEDKHTVYEVLKPESFLSNCSNHCIEERNQQKQNHHKLYTECLQKKKSLLLHMFGLKRMIQIVHALWKYVWTTRKLPWKCPDLFPSAIQVRWVKKPFKPVLFWHRVSPTLTFADPSFFCCSSVLSCQLRTLICCS